MPAHARGWQLACKRGLDIALALVGLLLTAPIQVLLLIWIWLDSGWPLLYRETRLGLNGRPFRICKLRTLAAGTAQQCSIAADHDARITAPGSFLRRIRLDELPQLWLVLTGTMSLVGPRPLSPGHAARVEPASLAKIQGLRPGCTGAAALEFIADDEVLAGWADDLDNTGLERLYLEAILPQKVAAELGYVENWSVATDIKLLARTFASLLSRRRAGSRKRVGEILEAFPGSG